MEWWRVQRVNVKVHKLNTTLWELFHTFYCCNVDRQAKKVFDPHCCSEFGTNHFIFSCLEQSYTITSCPGTTRGVSKRPTDSWKVPEGPRESREVPKSLHLSWKFLKNKNARASCYIPGLRGILRHFEISLENSRRPRMSCYT